MAVWGWQSYAVPRQGTLLCMQKQARPLCPACSVLGVAVHSSVAVCPGGVADVAWAAFVGHAVVQKRTLAGGGGLGISGSAVACLPGERRSVPACVMSAVRQESVSVPALCQQQPLCLTGLLCLVCGERLFVLVCKQV
jgi:hypothetical protein